MNINKLEIIEINETPPPLDLTRSNPWQ